MAEVAMAEELAKRGTEAYRKRDYEAALKLYNQAFENGVPSSALFNNIGAALHALERYDEELKIGKKAASFDPKNATAWYRMGMARYGQEDMPEAMRCFESGLRVDPNHEKLKDAVSRLKRCVRFYYSEIQGWWQGQENMKAMEIYDVIQHPQFKADIKSIMDKKGFPDIGAYEVRVVPEHEDSRSLEEFASDEGAVVIVPLPSATKFYEIAKKGMEAMSSPDYVNDLSNPQPQPQPQPQLQPQPTLEPDLKKLIEDTVAQVTKTLQDDNEELKRKIKITEDEIKNLKDKATEDEIKNLKDKATEDEIKNLKDKVKILEREVCCQRTVVMAARELYQRKLVESFRRISAKLLSENQVQVEFHPVYVNEPTRWWWDEVFLQSETLMGQLISLFAEKQIVIRSTTALMRTAFGGAIQFHGGTSGHRLSEPPEFYATIVCEFPEGEERTDMLEIYHAVFELEAETVAFDRPERQLCVCPEHCPPPPN